MNSEGAGSKLQFPNLAAQRLSRSSLGHACESHACKLPLTDSGAAHAAVSDMHT